MKFTEEQIVEVIKMVMTAKTQCGGMLESDYSFKQQLETLMSGATTAFHKIAENQDSNDDSSAETMSILNVTITNLAYTVGQLEKKLDELIQKDDA